VSLVGFITIFAASANASISAAIDSQLNTDYIVTSGGGNGAPTGISPTLGKEIAALPVIAQSTPVRLGQAGINDSRVFLNATDSVAGAALTDLDGVAGSFARIEDNGIAVSKRKADANHWKLGSVIPVTFVKTGKVPLTVRYIYKANTFGDYFISLKTYEKNFTDQLDFLILAKLKPGVSAEQGRKAIEPLLKPYPIAKLKDNAQYKADQKQVNQVLNLFYVLLFLAVIIALIGIANTMTLSIHERTKELGLLRAVGESRRQTRSMIRWEAVIIALLGVLLGIVIALFFGWAVIKALQDEGFSKFSPALMQLVAIVVIGGFASVLAALLPARRAARLNVLDAIQHE
jgi:putative ABC transport system permease protein